MFFYFEWSSYMSEGKENATGSLFSPSNDLLSFNLLKNAMHYDIILMLNKTQHSAIKIKYRLIIAVESGDIIRNNSTRNFFEEGEAEFRGNVCEQKVTSIIREPYTKIKMVGQITELTYEPALPILIKPKNCSHGDNLSSLLKDSKSCYVELVSRDKRRFRAHACILAARSPVFSSMFQHDMAEKQSGVVKIDDTDGDILQRLLVYIYTGRFYEEKTTKIEQLLIAADKYAIDQLKACCEDSLIKRLNVVTAVDALVLADDHYAENLKKRATQFILEHGKEVFQSPKFLEIETSRPKLAIEILRHKCL